MSERLNQSGLESDVAPVAWWRKAPWVLAISLLLILLWWRFAANVSDFGLRNVLTYLMAIGAWMLAVLGGMLTSPKRVWLAVLLIPVACVAGFLSFFRLVRVDSEIVPQFAWRWSSVAELPETQAENSAAADDFFAARATDYPKFLGPNGDSTLTQIELETDWSAHEPEVRWKQPIGKGWSGFAIQGDAAYTLEQRDQEEWVTCYDANSGKLVWHYAMTGLHFNPLGGAGPRSTPTIHNGRVYAASAVSELVCLDMQSGKLIWSADLLKLAATTQAAMEAAVAWGRSASPVIVDDKVIIPLGGIGEKSNTLVAFDTENGSEVWRSGSDQISYSTPTVVTLSGERQLLYVSEKNLASYSIADGQELWSVSWPSGSASDANVSQPIALDDKRVLMTKGYGGGSQLIEVAKADGKWTTKSIWKEDSVLRTKFTSCVVKDGFAYGLNDGILECVDLSNGKRAWKKGRYRHGQVILVGDTLLVTAENGSVVLVAADSKELRELASLPVIGDVTWNTAAISGNRLLMRNSDEAACVILPLKSGGSTANETAPSVGL